MARPNKLLMGIASLLGTSLKRKREKADYLERLGLEQATWEKRRSIQQNDAINQMLAGEGYLPQERATAFARRRLATEREELVAQGLDEKKTQGLFTKLSPAFGAMEPYLQDILKDSENYYPELHKKGKSDHRNSFLAMQKMQEIISGGLRAEGFPLDYATMKAEEIAPDFAKQAFGPQSDERRLAGLDLMRTQIREATTP
jgi:hypothetical protein